MKISSLFASQKRQHRNAMHCVMDLTVYFSFLCLICTCSASHIPGENTPVKLVPNSFQIIIQNSIPTSLPIEPKHSRVYPEPIGEVIEPYQADEAYSNLPWPVKDSLPVRKEVALTKVTPCKKSCPYGFETDIEGNELCRCRDPCKGVQCFGGMKCEPERQCLFDQCSYTAVCKADDVCSLPKPKYTFMCEKLSKRYYYDQKRGLCRKFWGCAEIDGNSFDNKKECKRSCYSKLEKQRDRKDRQNKKNSRESALSSQVSSELEEISNVIPTYQQPPSLNNLIAEDFEEKNNQVEMNPKSQYSSLFTNKVPGLNQLSGCPVDAPYEKCEFDPCQGCSSPNIMCFTSFCGKCQAIYIDLRTGEASDKFAPIC